MVQTVARPTTFSPDAEHNQLYIGGPQAVSSLSAAPFGGKTDHRRAWSCCDSLAKKQCALLPTRRRFSGVPFCADRQHSGISCGFPDVESSLSWVCQRETSCLAARQIRFWRRVVASVGSVRFSCLGRAKAGCVESGSRAGNSSRIHSPEDSLQPLACMGRRAYCRSSCCCRSVADRAFRCDVRVVARGAISR